MLRHIVLLRWNPTFSAEDRAAALSDLQALAGSMPGAESAVANADLGLADGNFDAALVIDFIDEQAWRAYQDAPAHREFVAQRLAPNLAGRGAIQLELTA